MGSILLTSSLTRSGQGFRRLATRDLRRLTKIPEISVSTRAARNSLVLLQSRVMSRPRSPVPLGLGSPGDRTLGQASGRYTCAHDLHPIHGPRACCGLGLLMLGLWVGRSSLEDDQSRKGRCPDPRLVPGGPGAVALLIALLDVPVPGLLLTIYVVAITVGYSIKTIAGDPWPLPRRPRLTSGASGAFPGES